MDEEEVQVPSIPEKFAVESLSLSGKYLQVVPSEKQPFGYLQFAADTVVSPFTKFEVENSNGSHKGLVHIRCVYNNKYWVLHSETSHFIVAAAKQPEEDQSKPTCTLFKPVYDEANGIFRLRHIHLNLFIHVNQQEQLEGLKSCMFVLNNNSSDDTAIRFTDWESLCILPRYVAFKGDNERYLRPSFYVKKKEVAYLKFLSSDISDPGVRNEIITLPSGVICIKNVPFNKYWLHNPNWIMVNGNENSHLDRHAQFVPIKLDNNSNVVALRCVANDQYCRRLSLDGKVDCLNAYESTIVDEAKMEVVELVLSRKIYNVNFRFSDSRTYNERPLILASSHGENLKDSDDKLSLKLSYEDTVTTTWSNTVSAKFGVEIILEAGIPQISENGVELTAEVTEENAWGRTVQKKSLVEVVHEVIVPKRSKVKVSIFASQATCDVPFSYSQKDKLLNGKTVIRRLHDGLFTGINTYNFKFVAEQEPI